ncbi:prepilin-type N-terminal cleavage/methylation domain-containing protein [Noviherbaspirillum sp.]|uniref:prepilin-type N-terminal cleavage/methylation domain-containing protein n=1 Tax=Noviherbaspirillum sp. TaxID=1926288 RepID=UPI002FDFCDD1
MKPITLTRNYERGFSLAEAVIVIVITGIIFAVVAMFIRLPVQGYVQSEARAELTDIADTALRRMSRDLRLALPNSVRVTNVGTRQYVEFLLTKTGARYLAEEDSPAAGLPYLKFSPPVNCVINPADCRFTVVGPLPAGQQAIRQNDFIVVYNLSAVGMAPANAYDCTGPCNRATVASDPAGGIITLTSNPFAAQPAPGFRSPGRHFHVVTTPVTYECDPATRKLTRYWNYPIVRTQPSSADSAELGGAMNALLATDVNSCAFSYTNIANQRNGLIGIALTLGSPLSDVGTVSLFSQVHVDNMP